jgi:PKD domain
MSKFIRQCIQTFFLLLSLTTCMAQSALDSLGFKANTSSSARDSTSTGYPDSLKFKANTSSNTAQTACCARVNVVPSTVSNCCSRLRIDEGCTVRSIKVVVSNGVFTSLNWNCNPAPINVAGLSTYTLIPASSCKSFDISACTKGTGKGIIVIDYVVTFLDGSVCRKTDTPKCPCVVTPCYAYKISGTTVNFDASTSTSNYPISSYHWDFGDGTTGTGVNSAHTYQKQGSYNVCLTVFATNNPTTGGGCNMKICKVIGVASTAPQSGKTCP